jgi:uncharacterized protein
LIDALRPSEISIADLALAALSHDLGHGPLSHAWEREVIGDQFDRPSLFKALGIPECVQDLLQDAPWHEITTAGLLLWNDGQLHRLLEDYSQGSSLRIVRLLHGKYWLEYLPGILSSEVDVDRADYLRRDTHQTGVAYGRYDLDWLVSTATVGETKDGEWVVGFDSRKAPRVVEQFLVARIALYETVYCHKTVRAAEGMVKNMLRRLKEATLTGGPAPFGGVFARSISGEPLSQEEILNLDDFSLFVLIQELSAAQGVDPIVRDLSQRILSRDLFKVVPVEAEKIRDFLQEEGAYDRLYAAMKPFCPGDPKHYLIRDDYHVKFFNSAPGEQNSTKSDSYFVDTKRRARPLREHQDLKEHKAGIRATRLFTLDSCVSAISKAVKER